METRLLAEEGYAEELSLITDELIDQFANEEVATGERELIERFILEAPARHQKLKFAIALKKRALEVAERRRFRRRVFFYLPIAAVVLIAFGVGVWFRVPRHSDVSEGLSALRLAYRDQRPVDARLSDFNYAPVVRGPQNIDSLQRGLAGSLLQSAAHKNPDAVALHALGQYYLTEHQFAQAVKQLQDSLQRDPNNAKGHNDLGVAFLELGKQSEANNDAGGALKYFADSHDQIKQAMKRDNSLLEARFNLCLVLEKEGLPQDAEKCWREYLEKDSTSQWAREARQRLGTLEESLLKAKTQANEELLEGFLKATRNRDDEVAWRILGWNREVVTGKFVALRLVITHLEAAINRRDEEAEQMLQALDYAGNLEMQKAGERYTAEVAQFYRRLSSRDRPKLAKAYSLASQGYELCRASGFEKAIPLFVEAQSIFESVNNDAESAFVGYWLAFSYRYSQRTVESRALCEMLIRNCRDRKYQWLLAQLLGLLSNIQTGSNEESNVINLSREALAISEQLNDAYGTQKYLASLAGKYSVVFNFPEALDHIARCLRSAGEYWPGTRQEWRNYDTATQIFNRLGNYSSSAAFGEAALRVAVEGSKDPSLIYLSYVHLGMAYGRLQNYEDGIRSAESGLRIGQSVEGNLGKEIMAYSALQLGELNRLKGDLNEAASRYDQAIGIYDQLAFQAFKFVAHRGRLLTYVAQSYDAGVEQELSILMALFDDYRSKIKEEENRTFFFDVAQEVYDAAIDFAHSRRRNDEEAFWYSESSRARSLLAVLQPSTGGNSTKALEPLSFREIKALIPEKTQIVAYSVLPNKLLIWVISKSKFEVEETTVSSAQLSEQVQGYLDLVARPSADISDFRSASIKLYDTLIGPIARHLINEQVVCFVPDKTLNYLPFATLVSAKSGRYLIQDYQLLFAPSANVFVANTEAGRHKRPKDGEKLLSVGNPSFDRKSFAGLADLPSAAMEADAVARWYESPSPLVLKTSAATRERVIAGMAQADVLHFASHYVVDERSPMRSQLLLAASSAGIGHHSSGVSGSLFARDIYQMKLTRPRLAVLAACTTAGDRYFNGEGMIGMARTFLAAGVPVVVASQWPVDTVATSGLMIKFHEYRRQGPHTTVAALRMAQTDIINDASKTYSHPYYWAPFIVIGGYSDF